MTPEQAARDITDGLDPVTLAVALSLLPGAHPLLTAARVGVEVAELRREYRCQMQEASHDVAGHPIWRGYSARRVSHAELMRRRALLGPMCPVGAA